MTFPPPNSPSQVPGVHSAQSEMTPGSPTFRMAPPRCRSGSRPARCPCPCWQRRSPGHAPRRRTRRPASPRVPALPSSRFPATPSTSSPRIGIPVPSTERHACGSSGLPPATSSRPDSMASAPGSVARRRPGQDVRHPRRDGPSLQAQRPVQGQAPLPRDGQRKHLRSTYTWPSRVRNDLAFLPWRRCIGLPHLRHSGLGSVASSRPDRSPSAAAPPTGEASRSSRPPAAGSGTPDARSAETAEGSASGARRPRRRRGCAPRRLRPSTGCGRPRTRAPPPRPPLPVPRIRHRVRTPVHRSFPVPPHGPHSLPFASRRPPLAGSSGTVRRAISGKCWKER